MRNPKPFVVIQNGKLIFTVYAYSLDQAEAIVAATVAGETIVVGVANSPEIGEFPMIPDTKNGLPAMVCVSAMQKAIRRSLEREPVEIRVRAASHPQSLPHHGLQPPDRHLPRRPRHAGSAARVSLRRGIGRRIREAVCRQEGR